MKEKTGFRVFFPEPIFLNISIDLIVQFVMVTFHISIVKG